MTPFWKLALGAPGAPPRPNVNILKLRITRVTVCSLLLAYGFDYGRCLNETEEVLCRCQCLGVAHESDMFCWCSGVVLCQCFFVAHGVRNGFLVFLLVSAL